MLTVVLMTEPEVAVVLMTESGNYTLALCESIPSKCSLSHNTQVCSSPHYIRTCLLLLVISITAIRE